jgi:hypothetical protein
MTDSSPSSAPRAGGLLALSRALALLALASCTTVRTDSDPLLEVRSPNGSELGVSTDYGPVFLGHTARSGEVDITAWFGDGPSIETAVVEPLGGGLYTAQTEIRLPTVPISFETPRPGQKVLVSGRRGSTVWEEDATVRSDPRVQGVLLAWKGRFENANDQLGAGVFVLVGPKEEKQLVGLVSGRLELTSADGSQARYLTVIGPADLWRLVTYRRDNTKKRRWVYREDIL